MPHILSHRDEPTEEANLRKYNKNIIFKNLPELMLSQSPGIQMPVICQCDFKKTKYQQYHI